jgi:hypothetical protein
MTTNEKIKELRAAYDAAEAARLDAHLAVEVAWKAYYQAVLAAEKDGQP